MGGSSVTFGTTVVVRGTGAVAVWVGDGEVVPVVVWAVVNVTVTVNVDIGMPVSVASGVSVPTNGTMVSVVVISVGGMVLVNSNVEVGVA